MKRFSFLILAFTLLLGGCSDDCSWSPDVPPEVPLELSAYVEGNVYTRTATPLSAGDVGVFLFAENGYTEKPYHYSVVGGRWAAGTPLILTGGTASVCVWYPFHFRIPANSSEVRAFTLNAQKYTAAADLCYQKTVSGLNNRNYTLQARLQHAYAQIEFHLSREITFKTAGAVSDITLAAGGLLKGITLDITTGTYSSPVAGAVSFPAGVTVVEGDETVVGVLLPPTTLTGDINLTFRVDGKDMTAVLPRAGLPELTAGTKYVVRGKLKRDLDMTVTVDPQDGTAGGEIVW